MTDVEPVNPAHPAQLHRGELAQIQAALLETSKRIPEMERDDAAEVWYAVDVIARDLASMRRDASNRLCEIAPRELMRNGKTRPVKTQLIEGLGLVLIDNEADREWKDKRDMAHAMYAIWASSWAKTHEGELPPPSLVIDFIFDLFSIGDPRVTEMRKMGLGEFDAVDEEGDGLWVRKFYTTKARVQT